MNTSVNSLMNKKYRFWGSSTCFRYLMQFLYTGAISGEFLATLVLCASSHAWRTPGRDPSYARTYTIRFHPGLTRLQCRTGRDWGY